MAATPASAQQIVQIVQDSPAAENFDIRVDTSADANVYMDRLRARSSDPAVAALRQQQQTSLARLRSDFAVDVIDSVELGTPEVVGVRPGPGFLTGAFQTAGGLGTGLQQRRG
jgi:hypothetical protein